jgi:MFS family permease
MNPSNLPAVAPPLRVPSEASKRLLPWLVTVAFFMESLDTTILNTAVPAISAALHVTPLSMKAVLASYTLSLAVFIPISGWVADRFGTRRVFATAIGLFTLGSFLCGISSNIDALVACRVLQGMGGSMMVPVGRMTLVRTFSKSGLLRAMSFVSIPALVAPMLGPIAGGLIVGYLHWRFIFFVNIPIGLAGLVLVYLYLPDYREEKTHPLDVVGLILFGSGIALLSYVLEVFGEHTLGAREITGLLVVSFTLLAGYWVHAKTLQFPLLQLKVVPDSHLPCGGWRRLVYAVGDWRCAFSSAASLLGRSWLYAGSVGVTAYAAGAGGHQRELGDTSPSGALWLPWSAGHKYDHHRYAASSVCDDWSSYADLGDCWAGIFVWGLQFAAVHKHEYAGLRGYDGGGDQCGELHLQHGAADGD